MAKESTYTLRLVGDAKSAEQALARAGMLTDELRAKIDKVNSDQIQIKGEQALRNLERLSMETESFGGKLRAVFSGQSQAVLDQFAGKLGPAGDVLKGIGPGALAAGAGVAALGIAVTKSIQEFTSLASSVASFKRITGATAEDSSRLVALLDDVGISAESGARAFQQLAKNVDSKAFANANIDIARTKTGSTDLAGTFLNVSRRLEGIKDPAERANVLIAAFGKQGEALGPIFDRGTEAIQRMMKANEGQVLSEDDLRRAREFHDAMDQLSDVAKDVAIGIAKIAVPVLTEAIKDFTWVVEHALAMVKKFGDIADFGASDKFKKLKEDAAAAVEKQQKAADATKEAADAQQQMADATEKANKATAAGYEAQLKALQTEERITSAKKAVADAQARVTEVEEAGAEKIAAAKKKILDLEAKRVDVAKDVTRAQEKLADASTNLTAVQQRENDAYFRFLQVMGRAQVDAKELADAQRDLADAQREVTGLAEREADARRSLADAQKALARDVGRLPAQAEKDVAAARRDQVRATERLADLEAKRSDTTLTSRERADLELDIADARDAVTDASWRVTDAEQALADVRDTLERKAADVVSKEQDLIDIHDEQSKAAQGVVDAEGKLVEVRDGAQPGSARAIEAEKNLKDARDATKTATEQVTTAEENLTKALDAQKDLPGRIKDAENDLVKVQQKAATDRIAAIESVNTALGNQKQLLLDIQREAALAGGAIPQSLDAAMPTTATPGTGVLLPGATTVMDSTGTRRAVAGTGKTGGSRSWRNNNPGNIKYGSFAKNHGATGQDSGGFAIFPSMEAGSAAQEALLFGAGYRNLSIAGALEKYSPAADNNPHNAARIADVARSTGVSSATRLAELSPAQRKAFLDAVTRTEGFKVGKETVQKFAAGALEELPTLDDAGTRSGQAVVGGMQRAMTSGVDIIGAASKALSDRNAAALEAAGQASVKTVKATVLTLSQLYAEFAKTSNIGQAAAGLSQAPARYVGGQNADGSNIVVHAFAANPVYGGTLFDKNGQQVYADDAAGIREALDPSNPFLNAPPSIEQMGRATPRGGIQNFATGGIVTGETFARIGEAGPEAVIPLSSGMASGLLGGPTVNVYVSGSVISERDLVDKIRKELIVAQQRGQTLVI